VYRNTHFVGIVGNNSGPDWSTLYTTATKWRRETSIYDSEKALRQPTKLFLDNRFSQYVCHHLRCWQVPYVDARVTNKEISNIMVLDIHIYGLAVVVSTWSQMDCGLIILIYDCWYLSKAKFLQKSPQEYNLRQAVKQWCILCFCATQRNKRLISTAGIKHCIFLT